MEEHLTDISLSLYFWVKIHSWTMGQLGDARSYSEMNDILNCGSMDGWPASHQQTFYGDWNKVKWSWDGHFCCLDYHLFSRFHWRFSSDWTYESPFSHWEQTFPREVHYHFIPLCFFALLAAGEQRNPSHPEIEFTLHRIDCRRRLPPNGDRQRQGGGSGPKAEEEARETPPLGPDKRRGTGMDSRRCRIGHRCRWKTTGSRQEYLDADIGRNIAHTRG